MRILITGSCGFIGAHAAARFLHDGHEVIGFDNLSRPGTVWNLEALQKDRRFHFVNGDVRSPGDVKGVFTSCGPFDVVLHEAAQVAVTSSVVDPWTDFQINAGGTLALLEAVRAHCPSAIVIYPSTNKVYGEIAGMRTVEGPHRYACESVTGISECQPLEFHSPYGCSKGAADQYVRDYARVYGMRTVVFRQSCIYGTQQFGVEDQGWVAWFTIAAVLGQPLTVYGNGKQVRDLLWVDDLVDLYVAAIERIDLAAGRIYNAGGGGACTLSLLELLQIMRTRHGYDPRVTFSDWRPGDQKVFVSDCRAAARDLSWHPTVTPLEGVSRLIEWTASNQEAIASVLGITASAALRVGAGGRN